MAFLLYMCILILFLFFLASAYVPTHTLPKLQHPYPNVPSNFRTTMARSPDLSQIEQVLNILERNIKCLHNVRTDPQMILAFRREWAAISQNDMRHYWYDASMMHSCMRADGGHSSN